MPFVRSQPRRVCSQPRTFGCFGRTQSKLYLLISFAQTFDKPIDSVPNGRFGWWGELLQKIRTYFSQRYLSKIGLGPIVLYKSLETCCLRAILTDQAHLVPFQASHQFRMKTEASNSEHIRPVDQSVLDILAQHPMGSSGGLTVLELTEKLSVTATAIRQRLERLVEAGLIEREKNLKGRGRPQFRYQLSKLGQRLSGASYADLATALWQELIELPNPQQRSRIMRRVAARMGQGLLDSVPSDAPISEKMAATADALVERRIAAAIDDSGDLPVLDVQSCPYPELANEKSGRQLCEMEQEMLSEAIGHSIQLDCCRLDGHTSCQFRPVIEPEPKQVNLSPPSVENSIDLES